MVATAQHCLLCETVLDSHIVSDEYGSFCCAGCRAVYSVLQGINQLADVKTHPIFRQAIATGLISNPKLLDAECKNVSAPENEFLALHLDLDGLWCGACADLIRLVLMQKKGIRRATVDYACDFARIEYAPRIIAKEEILQEIRDLGYGAKPLALAEEKTISTDLWIRFIIAAFCSMNTMMSSYPLYANAFGSDIGKNGEMLAWIQLPMALPVIFYSAWPIWRRLYNGLFVGKVGMELLVFIGVFSAFFLSCYELWRGSLEVYFDTATTVVALVLLGKILESRAKFSSRKAMLGLLKKLPKRARKVLPDGSYCFVLAKELSVGDTVAVFSGERVVLDGIVIQGTAAVCEAHMTGESLPKYATANFPLLSGSLVTRGQLHYSVTTPFELGVFEHIAKSCEKDLQMKPKAVQAADVVSKVFVPVVCSLALGTALFLLWQGATIEAAVLRGLSVLLISCPCAIGLAAPIAEARLMRRLTAKGVIVRNRAILPLLGREKIIFFDKTGTVTTGTYTVHTSLDDLDNTTKAVFASMARLSTHPKAQALAQALSAFPSVPLDSFEERMGEGLFAIFGTKSYSIERGNDCLLVFPGGTKELVMGDTLREGVKGCLEALKKPCILLSGDSQEAVSDIAKKTGFTQFFARQTPLQKREHVAGSDRPVMFVGDGINDAPALACADIGVSVVSATDMSIQVSDIFCVGPIFEILPQISALGRLGQKIVLQNLFWAFIYNVFGLALAVFGVLSPLFSAFAMLASSAAVILNANRLEENTR